MGKAEAPREGQGALGTAHDMHLGALRLSDLSDEQSDGAGADHEQGITRAKVRAAHRPQGVPSGLHERAENRVEVLGQRDERGSGHGEAFGEGTGPPVAHADLVARLAQVLTAVQASRALAATEHRVARDASPHPGCVAVVAYSRPRGPVHSWPMRMGNVASPETRYAMSPR